MRIFDKYLLANIPREGEGAGGGGGQQQQQQQQQQQKPWYDGKADAETIGHWDNKGWKKDDPAEIALQATKAARELQKHFGVPADQIIKLPKDATDEAGWRGVRERLGMPKEAKDYDLSAVKFGDGTDLDTAFADTMRGALHKAGVAKDAAPEIAKAVVGYLDAADKAEAAERTAKVQTERAALQKEWGTNFEFNRLTAMQGAKRLGVDEATVAKLENDLGYAKVMEMFRKIGAGTSEDTFNDAGGGTNPATRNGAIARREELLADKDWTKRWLAGGATERREMDNLILLIQGEAA